MKKLSAIIIILISFGSIAQTNYAVTLNGTNQYISIGAPLSTGSSYTKEAWVYATTLAGARNIISSLNTPFWINGGILSAGQAGSYSLVTDPGSFPLNRWVHAAVTYDAATTTMRLYRDGILVSTNTSVPAYSSENEFIGSHAGSASYLQGNVDEVRLWNTALTQQQIKEKMYTGPEVNATGLVAYYKCNDGAGSTLSNSCTNPPGLNGNLQNSPTWVNSPVQFASNAISFDGTNDFVTIPDDNTLDITTAITLEAWVYATKNTGVQNVISKSSNSTNTGYIFPRTDNGWTSVVLYLHIGGGWRTLSAVYPSLNAWHHLAATYDGTMMRLYIDGVLAASQARTGAIATNNNVLALGNQTGFSEYFGGIADEFRIWNVARSQAEIQANMNKELNAAIETGLVSYYTFNLGITSGTNTGMITAVDKKGNNNGTLTNFALSGSSSNFLTQNASIIVLPVSWLSFTAQQKNKAVLLSWSTAQEENTKDFIVQHSSNGTAWIDIGKVQAAGHSNGVKEYSFVHNNPVRGANYYRILQMDLDGRSSYSIIRSVILNNDEPPFTVFSNRVSNGQLQVNLKKPEHLYFYSTDGRLLWQQQLKAGINFVDIGSYAKGFYFLRINRSTEKIVIL